MPHYREWESTRIVIKHKWISEVKVNVLDRLTRQCVSASKVDGTASVNWDRSAQELVQWIRKEFIK